MAAKRTGEAGWKWRRGLFIAVMGFAMWRLMVLEDGADTRLNETIAWAYSLMIMTGLVGFTGFATAQDIAAILATRSGLPYANPAVPSATPADPNQPPPGYAG